MRFLGMDMARQSNRRWLVAVTYVALLAFGATLWTLGGHRGEPIAFTLLLLVTSLFVNQIVFGGYGCWGLIRPFNTHGPLGSHTSWHNDERDLRRRDRMHFYAYRIVVSLIVLGYFLGRDPFQHPQVGNALLVGALIFGLTLPQALLLWIEPDMEFEEPAAPEYPRA
jgi:hydrogenase/urease accessory protein HupE